MPEDPARPPVGPDDPAERLAQFERARGLEHDAVVPGYDEGDEDIDAGEGTGDEVDPERGRRAEDDDPPERPHGSTGGHGDDT